MTAGIRPFSGRFADFDACFSEQVLSGPRLAQSLNYIRFMRFGLERVLVLCRRDLEAARAAAAAALSQERLAQLQSETSMKAVEDALAHPSPRVGNSLVPSEIGRLIIKSTYLQSAGKRATFCRSVLAEARRISDEALGKYAFEEKRKKSLERLVRAKIWEWKKATEIKEEVETDDISCGRFKR